MTDTIWPLDSDYIRCVREEMAEPRVFRDLYEQHFPPPSDAYEAGIAAYKADRPNKAPEWIRSPELTADWRRGWAHAADRDAAHHERAIGKV